MDKATSNPAIPNQNTKETVNTSVSSTGQPQVYKAVRAIGVVKPTYQLQTKNFGNDLQVIGTAFWLKDYKILVTCAHVVQGLLAGSLEQTGLLVVGNLGKYTRATIAALDLAHDLAVLQVVEETPQFINQEANSGLQIVDDYPQVGSAVGYAGFPMGSQLLNSIHSPTYAEGVVAVQLREGLLRKEIQITGAVAGGYSGAPVVLKDDPTKVIGVLSSGPSAPGTQGNIFMAISWKHVKALAELAKS